MNDNFTLGLTAALTVFFLVCGVLDILSNPVIKWLTILGYVAVIAKIIFAQSQDDKQKNPPD